MSSVSSIPADRAPTDPRPELVRCEGKTLLAGSRCGDCNYPIAATPPRCPKCGSDSMAQAVFGPLATVFSSTVLRIPVPGRTPPFALAYVDIDDGPRILVHVDGVDQILIPGSRVELLGWNELGDPVAVAHDQSIRP